MKILVLGSGLMGPAAAFNAMSDPDVSQVTLCDMNTGQLAAAAEKLGAMEGGEKVTTVALDLNDQAAASQLMAGYDAVVAALEKTDLMGVYGRIRFDPKSHQVIPSLDPKEGAVGTIFQWQAGKRVVVFPQSIAMGEIKLPPWMK